MDDSAMEDDLRPEYDLSTLQVRRLGPKRTSFGGLTVRLDPDVAEMFPNADAVNEALRFLIRAKSPIASGGHPSPALSHLAQLKPIKNRGSRCGFAQLFGVSA
jgi:hypothetical protein